MISAFFDFVFCPVKNVLVDINMTGLSYLIILFILCVFILPSVGLAVFPSALWYPLISSIIKTSGQIVNETFL